MAFLIQHEWSLAGFFAVLIGIALTNLWGIPRLRASRPNAYPKVSLLVPMRDEEANASECLASLLAQDYPNFEVLVYEEGSRDRTREILSSVSDRRLQILPGREPPPGWLGKSWACQELAKQASGDLLLFVDADVRLDPRALATTTAKLEKGNLDFLSVLPRQVTHTLGELLVISIIPWSLASFFPLLAAQFLHKPGLSATVGQFLLVRRSSYEALGGHAAVRDQIVEDLTLARLATQAGLRLRLYLGGMLVSCRMYHGLRAAVAGLSKNLYPVFGRRLGLFVFVWTWILYSTWQPIVLIIIWAVGLPGIDQLLTPAAWAIGLSALLWTFTSIRFLHNLKLPFLYPLVVITALGVAANSAFWYLSSRGTWKGRSIHVKKGG
jgi:chlorobactene glucosyltransferase